MEVLGGLYAMDTPHIQALLDKHIHNNNSIQPEKITVMSRIGRQSNQGEEEKKLMNSSSQQARSMRRKQACSHSTV